MPLEVMRPKWRAGRPWAPDFADVIEEDLERRGVVTTTDTKYGIVALVVSSITTHITLDNEDLVLCDCSSGGITVSLPPAATKLGKEYRIKKIDSSRNVVTIDPYSIETIDGEEKLMIDYQYKSPNICSDESN